MWIGVICILALTITMAYFVVSANFASEDVKEEKEEKTNANEKQREKESNDGAEVKEEVVTEASSDENGGQTEMSDIGVFIAKQHEFYNRTTGYGKLDSLQLEEQKEQASAIIKYIDNAEDYGKVLKQDIESIHSIANQVVNGEEQVSHVQSLHRMFHDLDIAINGYTNYKKVWGVTKTYESVVRSE